MSYKPAATSLDWQAVRATLADAAKGLATTPTLQTFENAAQAAYDPSEASSLGLTRLLDKDGSPVAETLPSGMTASAFVDASGNVLIAYQGTSSSAQYALDGSLLSGSKAPTLQGFQDAVSFAHQAEAIATAEEHNQTEIYVTGHSLGGTLAEYVASQTGLGGVSFAGSGVPGNAASATPAANFVSYVERGDPFANYGTDSAEAGSAVVANTRFDHYGTVVQLGTEAGAASLASVASEVSGHSFDQLESGDVPGGVQTAASVFQQLETLMGEYHGLATYEADVSATMPVTAFGLQNVSLSTFMKSVMADLPSLDKDLPAVFGAGNGAAMLGRFASDFPGLAREATALMHASSFGAAMGELATVDPTIYDQVTTASGAAAVLNALSHQQNGVIIARHIA